jgi:hypothetical protein
MKKIDCTKTCKMTKELRESRYCKGFATVVDNKIFYSCKENIKDEPKEVRQFLLCDLWNLGLKESCQTCLLDCTNNQNPQIQDALNEKKKLDDVIEKLRPNMILYGVSSEQVEQISKKYTQKNADGKRNQMGVEAIEAANFANDTLKAALSGKMIDVAFFSLYARKKSGKIKKLRNKLRNHKESKKR